MYSSEVIASRNFPFRLNLPKHVPMLIISSRGTFVAFFINSSLQRIGASAGLTGLIGPQC
jgi:hypothetical protein